MGELWKMKKANERFSKQTNEDLILFIMSPLLRIVPSFSEKLFRDRKLQATVAQLEKELPERFDGNKV